MKEGNLRQHLENFYRSEFASQETVDRLKLLAQVDAFGAPARNEHRGWSVRLTGIAAGLALVFSSLAFYSATQRPTQTRLVRRTKPDHALQVRNTAVSNKKSVPRLVAVKFQIDGCPISAATESVFCELVDEFAEKPVLFARYDMTNSARQKLSANWASNLGIDWACQGASQSGTILLIDRDTCEVVSKLTTRQELPQMMQTLNRKLH